MKKKELFDKFVLYAFQFNAREEYVNAAWRLMNEFGIENGCVVEDLDKNDFVGSSLYNKRREQIEKTASLGNSLTKTMLVDYLVYVGEKIITDVKNKVKKDREEKNEATSYLKHNFSLTKKNLQKIKEYSEQSGKSLTEVVEGIINYYCDLDDSEK